jgi:2-iminobutanoate/2-iminopropanoate deaminase
MSTVMANLQAVLKSAGCEFGNVVKTTIYLKNIGDFTAMNEAYAKALGDHRPARATVEVARLPKDALVEIDCIAVIS